MGTCIEAGVGVSCGRAAEAVTDAACAVATRTLWDLASAVLAAPPAR